MCCRFNVVTPLCDINLGCRFVVCIYSMERKIILQKMLESHLPVAKTQKKNINIIIICNAIIINNGENNFYMKILGCMLDVYHKL